MSFYQKIGIKLYPRSDAHLFASVDDDDAAIFDLYEI